VSKAYLKGPTDAAVIGRVLLFMAIVRFAQEMKARKAMAALLRLSAPKPRYAGRQQRTCWMQPMCGDRPTSWCWKLVTVRVAADARLTGSGQSPHQ